MSIQVPIKPADKRRIDKALRTETEVICLNESAYLRTLLVAQDRLYRGLPVMAKVVKGYSDRT